MARLIGDVMRCSGGSMDISIRNLFMFLMFLVFILLGMHLGMHFVPEHISWTIANRFSLDSEANVPTWYSTVLLFSVSLCSLIIYFMRNNVVEHDHLGRLFWLVFGAVYCFLSLDEAAGFHEIIDNTTSMKWVFVYAPFGAIFFIICTIYFIVIRNNEKKLRNWILGGLIVYAVGWSTTTTSPRRIDSPFWLPRATRCLIRLLPTTRRW